MHRYGTLCCFFHVPHTETVWHKFVKDQPRRLKENDSLDRSKKLHSTDEELKLPAFIKMLSTMIDEPTANMLRTISLSLFTWKWGAHQKRVGNCFNSRNVQ